MSSFVEWGLKNLNESMLMMRNTAIMQKGPTWMAMQEIFVFQTESDFLLNNDSMKE
jgi:hypothetical protein